MSSSGRPVPPDEHADPAAVLVARDAGLGAVTACGLLVDRNLGVTSVVGPRILNDQQHALFTRTFFAGSLRMPVPVAWPVAHRIVFDGVRRARAYGCEPVARFEAARRMLEGPARSRRDRPLELPGRPVAAGDGRWRPVAAGRGRSGPLRSAHSPQ